MAHFVAFCCLLVLLVAFSVEAVEIVQPLPKNILPITGSELLSTCIFVGENGQPPLMVKFQRKKIKKDWLDIADTQRVYQTNKTEDKTTVTVSLHIKNITVEDGTWSYSCVGFSTGEKEARYIFSVTVTKREDLPVALVRPNLTVSSGDTAKLYCILTHKNKEPAVTIKKVTFLKDGIPVKSAGDIKEPLTIADVAARDGGSYGCLLSVLLHKAQAYNVTPTMTAYLHVRVRFPFKESKVVADAGDSVALNCSAEGYPLNVIWKKNKPGSTAVIKPSGRFTLRQQCPFCQSALVIQNVITEDSGKYSCSVRDYPGQQVFLVTIKADSTLSVTAPTSSSLYLTTILPALLWTWGPV